MCTGESPRGRRRGTDLRHAVRSLLILTLLSPNHHVVVFGSPPLIQTVVVPRSFSAADEWFTTAADILQRDGVVVLSCAELLSLAPPQRAAINVLEGRLKRVADRGGDILEPFSFSEIVHRSPKRYDCSLPTGGTSPFSLRVNELVKAVLAAKGKTSPAVVRDGIVTSFPGASAQPMHADGEEDGVFNAFVPLVDVSTQGTEFWLGTHQEEHPKRIALAEKRRSRRAAGDEEEETPTTRRDLQELEAESSEQERSFIVPTSLARAEGVVLFDYRVLHRGRAHAGSEGKGEGQEELGQQASSSPRPVFYRVFAVGDNHGADAHNFPANSLDDST